MVSHDDIRTLALSLPGAFEQASFGGHPSWRTKPRMFAWIREDPEALVVWVESEDEKQAMITESWRLRAPRSLVKGWDAAHP